MKRFIADFEDWTGFCETFENFQAGDLHCDCFHATPIGFGPKFHILNLSILYLSLGLTTSTDRKFWSAECKNL